MSGNGGGLTAGNNLTVTADPVIEADALSTVSSIVQDALDNSANTTTAVGIEDQQTAQQLEAAQNQENQQLGGILNAVLAADQATTANTASGGQTNTNSTVLWVVGIAAVALIALVLFGKKS